MDNKVFVSWKEIEEYIEKVIEDLNERKITPSGVYGIPRGGMIMATLLSYKLNVPLLLNAAQNCIIIDDIADSGRTLLHFTKNDTQFHKFYITTMYYHERSAVVPDFWCHKKGDKWIVFPWEIGEVLPIE